MEFDDFKVQLVEKIKILTTRLEINDLVGISTAFDKVPEAKVHADDFLKQSLYNRIRVENVIVLTDVENKEALTQDAENKRIENDVSEFEKYLFSEGEGFVEAGEFKYELNELFKQIIRFIDGKMEEMNYNSWHQKNNPKDLNNCGHVLLNHERFMYSLYKLDFSSYCEELIHDSFNFRRESLQDLKNIIVNVFSEYLFLPNQKFLPKFSYSCDKIDICELIVAMMESKEFGDPEKLKAMFLSVFEISQKEFTDRRGEINKRRSVHKKSRNKFLEEFSKAFN